jgi:protease-4
MNDGTYKPAKMGTDGPIPPGIPPVAARAPMPARGSGRVWRILTLLLAIGLIGSLAANVLLVGTFGVIYGGLNETPGAAVDEELIHSGSSSDKIAILPIEGEVDGAMSRRVAAFCDAVTIDPSIKAIVLEVDSPGGTITASDEIYNALLTLKKSRDLKMYVSMQSLAASGGYYISMAGDKLYAEPTTLAGSIGVIWPAFEVSRLLDKIGVTPEVIKSDQANEFKDAGSPLKKFTEEDRAYIRGLVNHAHARFRDIVASSRDKRLHASIDDIAVGKIWTADDALKLGVIDEIGYRDDVCSAIAHDTGLVSPTIVRLREKHSVFETLGLSAAAASPKMSVTITPEMLNDLRSPRMEYRWQP